MINVSTQLKKESLTNRNYYVTANVTLSNGTTLKLGKKDFYLSGNSLVDSADSGDFPVGVAIEKTASLSLVNDDGRFDGYNFNAARFVIFLNVQLSDRIEAIKRGTYIVSKKPATASEISLKHLHCSCKGARLRRVWKEGCFDSDRRAGKSRPAGSRTFFIHYPAPLHRGG